MLLVAGTSRHPTQGVAPRQLPNEGFGQDRDKGRREPSAPVRGLNLQLSLDGRSRFRLILGREGDPQTKRLVSSPRCSHGDVKSGVECVLERWEGRLDV